ERGAGNAGHEEVGAMLRIALNGGCRASALPSREESMSGRVYLIGAGPGDPDLITIKGLHCLEIADCVIYDYLVNTDLLKYAPRSAEFIHVGKKAGEAHISQEQINALIVEKAKSGMTVARLKGGDPFIFGRGGEEAAALAEAGI